MVPATAPRRHPGHCTAPQRTATHRNAPQRTATHRNAVPATATRRRACHPADKLNKISLKMNRLFHSFQLQ